MAAAFALCFLHLGQAGGIDLAEPRTLFCLVAAVLVLARHQGNLRRLFQGTEPRVGDHPALFTMLKTLHVLALGLWFGAAVFFTFVVTPSLFSAFDSEAQKKARPLWFPLPDHFAQDKQDVDGPREQGARAAGFAVGPLFTWFFLLQSACGLVALGTALPWSTLGKKHRWRAHLLLLALLTVIVGWPIERRIAHLRNPRHAAVDGYLRADPGLAPQALEDMKAAKSAFARWHVVSLLLNFVTLGLVAVAMALAAQLPPAERTSRSTTSAAEEESTEVYS